MHGPGGGNPGVRGERGGRCWMGHSRCGARTVPPSGASMASGLASQTVSTGKGSASLGLIHLAT
jgi:hypothetical protein